jgi:hypothetical protein
MKFPILIAYALSNSSALNRIGAFIFSVYLENLGNIVAGNYIITSTLIFKIPHNVVLYYMKLRTKKRGRTDQAASLSPTGDVAAVETSGT